MFAIGLIFSFSCSSDDSDDNDREAEVTIRVNGLVIFDDGDDFDGDVDGDFEGDGGSDTKTFVWLNNKTTADYNADITAVAESSFRMVVRDSQGTVVLDQTIQGATEPDSIDGVTSAGVSGLWSVTITLDSFDGDGSFSLSEGD